MKLLYEIDPKLEYQSLTKQCFIPHPKIITVHDFNEEAYVKFSKDVSDAHSTGQGIIPVIIDSFGGEVYSLMGMLDVIKNSDIPIATIIQTKVMSCGIALFSAGTEGLRFMAPYSTLMMHEVSGGTIDKISEMEVRIRSHES